MSKKTVGIVVGSLRKGAFSKSIADCISKMLEKDFNVKMINISNLAIFNQDFDDEGTTPKEWTAFREEVKNSDAFLFVTPEYNRSIPPVLKNALDIASRPYGQNVWGGKPGAIVSVSPGGTGGFGANHHLRQTMSFLNIYMLQQPEMYIGNVTTLLDDKGNVINKDTIKFFQSFTDEYTKWVDRF